MFSLYSYRKERPIYFIYKIEVEISRAFWEASYYHVIDLVVNLRILIVLSETPYTNRN